MKISEVFGLDYECVRVRNSDCGDWEIWTPDSTGACIGSGKTRKIAFRNAASNLACAAADMLCNEISPNKSGNAKAGALPQK